MTKQYFSWLEKLYREEVPGLALAIFRIVYGLVLFGEIWQIYYFRHLIFDPVPYVEYAAFSITPFMLVWLLSIVFIIVGLFTRMSAFINYLFTVFVIGFSFHTYPGSLHEYHIDTELLTVAFILIFMPVSRRLSFDRLIEVLKYSTVRSEHTPATTVSAVNYFILTLAAGLIYFDSIFYKYASPMWLSGLGVWLPASQPWASWLDLSWILNQKYLMLFLGYLTLFFQTTYIFLVWFKRLKPFYIWVGIGLHIGIFFAFPIPWFALGMVAIYLGLIPSEVYLKIKNIFITEAKNKLVFLYDKECPLCNRLRLIVEFLDYRKAVTFKNVQENAGEFDVLKGIGQEELLENVYSVGPGGKVYSGIDTYRQVMIRVWLFKPLGFLMFFPPVRLLGKAVYDYIARHRIRYGCNAELCVTDFGGRGAEGPVDTDSVKILQTLSVKDLKIRLVGAFIAFIVFSQLVLIQKSFLMQHIYEKSGMNQTTRDAIAYLAKGYEYVIYPLTGLMSHPVFMDFHFKNYNHEVSIVYQDQNTLQHEYLPIIDEKGQASYYDSGRQWVHWSFRTNISKTGEEKSLELKLFESNANKFLYFWAEKNGIDLHHGRFIIQMKRLDVPYDFEYDHLSKMVAKPWEKIAEVTYVGDRFIYQWEHDKLLDYMK